MQGTLNKTLFVRFSSVGDLLLTTPALRSLRRRFPECRIDVLVRSEYAGLLRGNPSCNTILEFPAGGTLAELLRLRERVRQAGYDLIVDLHGSLRSRILCHGLRNVVRFRKRVIPRWLLLRFKADWYSLWGGSPGMAERYLEALRPWGVRDDCGGLEVFPPAEARAAADELAATVWPSGREEGMVGIAPSARHATKRWPWEHFAETGAELSRKHRKGVIIFGGAEDRELCGSVSRRIRELHPTVELLDASGRLPLLGTAALMDRCAVVVTNDSGLMHLAAARKRRIVACFGSTVRQFGFYPPAELSIVVEEHGLPCRPCTHIGRAECPLGHFRCMTAIAPARVTAAASAFIES
jgi:heptosyltransferase-2